MMLRCQIDSCKRQILEIDELFICQSADHKIESIFNADIINNFRYQEIRIWKSMLSLGVH